ncbi:unnamed protein product, partial [Brassica rapa subsp. narinosa]
MKKNQKVVPNESRRQSLRVRKPDSAAKKPEPRVQKSKKSSKKSKKSRPVREPARAPSVESLSVSDESEREGSDREGSEREVLAFECIPDLGKTFRIYSEDASEECPRMCKSQFTKSSLRGYPLEDIYAAVGETKVINSVLVPTIGEQIMMARIIDEEREYDRQGSPSDTWNYWLNVKQKNIWWEELYELDQAARGVLPKKKDKEKVTFAEGSSSNSGLDSRLQGLEERILEFMGEGFAGLHVTVETMLESQSSKMSVLEKNQRLLRRRAKKIEDRLTSIESKVEPSHGEDMDFRQWDNDTYEEKDKACSEKEKANAEHEAGKEKDNIENTEEEGEKEADDNAQQEGEKEKENSEADEEEDSESESEELKQMKERSRRQAAKLWKEIANEEKIGGKHDEEESEEKEAETSEEENENNDEKDEEKVVESEAEGEDDQVESERTPKDDDNEPRVETNRTGETPTPPRGSQLAGTPTPPRGRTKAMAARRPIIRRMEDEPGKGEKVVEEEKQKKEAVETEEKNKGGSWSFTRKHRVLGSCIGASRMSLLLHLRRVADQRGNHSGCRLLSRRGRSVKQS